MKDVTAMRTSRRKLFVVAVLFGLPALAAAAGLPANYGPQEAGSAFDASRRSGKPMLVYFSQPDCEPCARTESVLATGEAAAILAGKFHFISVDASRPEDPFGASMKRSLKLRGTPALAAISPTGDALCVLHGNIRDNAELREIAARIVALNEERLPPRRRQAAPSCRGTVSPDDNRLMAID